MPDDQYRAFVTEGYFTIRRSHHFWSGIFTDQTIEQVLMRNLKAPGGLAHGRGVAESMQAKFIHAISRCIAISNSLEFFVASTLFHQFNIVICELQHEL